MIWLTTSRLTTPLTVWYSLALVVFLTINLSSSLRSILPTYPRNPIPVVLQQLRRHKSGNQTSLDLKLGFVTILFQPRILLLLSRVSAGTTTITSLLSSHKLLLATGTR